MDRAVGAKRLDGPRSHLQAARPRLLDATNDVAGGGAHHGDVAQLIKPVVDELADAACGEGRRVQQLSRPRGAPSVPQDLAASCRHFPSSANAVTPRRRWPGRFSLYDVADTITLNRMALVELMRVRKMSIPYCSIGAVSTHVP